MKKRQLTALLLSAVLSFSVLMPASGISALAAEDTGPQASPEEEIQIPLTEEEASPEESTGIDDTGGLQEDVTAAPAESSGEAFAEDPEDMDFEEDSAPETAEEALPAEEEAQTQETVIPEPAGSEDSSWQTETEQNPVDDLEIPSAETASESGTDSSSEVLVPADGEQEEQDHEIIAEPSEEKETAAPTEAAVSSENDLDSAEEIRIGDSFDVTVTEESPYAFFRFTPESDIRACIYSESENDTFVDLLDSAGDIIVENDDDGAGNNFKLVYSFQAGETYYFRVRMYSYQDGTFSVLLKEYVFFVDRSQEGDIYAEPHETIELHTAAASDTALTYTWSVNGEETQTGSSDSYSYTADNRAEITCEVTDENGNSDVVYYYIYINIHWSIRTPDGTVFAVEKGQSQTLQVEPDPEEGYEDAYTFTYSWLDEEGTFLSGSDSTFTVPEVNGSQIVTSQVKDQFDNSQTMSFRLYNPGWLNVYPSGSQEGSTSYIRYCEPGESVTLSVSSAEEEGGITYSWYDENDSLLASGEEQEYLLEDVRTYRTIRCHAEDQNGNCADLLFYVRINSYLTVYPEGSEYGSGWISIDITGKDSVVLRTFAENSAGLAVTFQWQKQSMIYDPDDPDYGFWPEEWTDISGSEDAVYTVTDPQTTDRYRCVVRDEAGNTGSAFFEFYSETPDFSAEELSNAAEISFGDSVPVEVTEKNPVALFRFTPEADGTYELYSESGGEYLDTFATLCNSIGVRMAEDDSGAGNGHFSLRTFLEGGQTYYFGVKEYCNEAARFTIHLVSGETSDWLSDYNYSLENDQIRLTGYRGDGGAITVPGSATARGQEFHRILLSQNMWENSDITSLTLEKGVVIPAYAGCLVNNMEHLVSADLSKADFSNTVDLSDIFYSCPSLVTVDLGGADLSNIEACTSLYYNCNRLNTIAAPVGVSIDVPLPKCFLDGEGNKYTSLPQNLNSSITLNRVEESEWLADYSYECSEDEITLTRYFGNESVINVPGSASVDGKEYHSIRLVPGLWDDASITEISFEQGVILPEDCSRLFNTSTLEKIDLSNVDTAEIQDVDAMFGNGYSLQEIHTPVNLKTSISLPCAFTDPDGTLYSDLPMDQAVSLTLTRASVSDWLADYSYEIDGDRIRLRSYIGREYDAALTVQASAVINGRTYQTIELSPGIWRDCYWDVSSLVFENGVVLPEDCSDLFANSFGLRSIDLSNLDWSHVTRMDCMFYNCEGLSELSLQGMDTGRVTSMSEMFENCWNLTSLDLSGLNTANVTDMSYMFYNCSRLTSLDLSGLDTRKVTDMSGMFALCYNLSSLDLNGFRTAEVTDMSSMFYNCGSLETLNLGGLETGNVTDLSSMFCECGRLTELDLSGFDLSAARDLSQMFAWCYELASVKMNGSRASNVTDMSSMFRSCSSLTEISLNGLTAENVEDMSCMFDACTNLVKADLSSLKTTKVTSVNSMFTNCFELSELNLSGSDFSGISDFDGIFKNANTLKTIYVPTGLTEVIHLPAVYQGSNGALYGTLPRRLNKSMCILYARDLKPGESGDPVYAAGVTLSASKYTYNGTARKPSVTVKSGDTVLTAGTDYTVAYKNNVKAGTATVTVTGKGLFTSSVSKTFTIDKAAQTITLKAPAKTRSVGQTMKLTTSGAKESPKVTFKSSNTAIATVNSTTGAVTAKKVGKVTFTATSAATANYKAGKATVTVNIVPAATASITAANQAKGIKLTWKKVAGATGYSVYRGSTLIKKITSGSTVTYTDAKANTNGAKYTFKIVPTASTGTGVSKSCVTYRVARPAISSLTNSASKRMTVKWGKNAKATSYQIQYGLKSNFSGAKTVSAAKAATVSKVITGLAKGKTYYVRIRTCKKVGKSTYTSLWSAAKKVKISK